MNRVIPFFQRSILIIFILTSFTTHAQTRLSDIENNRIKQKSIRAFLKNQIEKGIVNFEDFRPSVDAQTDSSQFDSNIHRFHLQQTPAVAWNAYITAHPAKIWQGRIVSCGFIYSPVNKRIIFADDKYPGLESGQIFFIEMRVLCGLVKFPVCFIVTRINESEHSITFSYVSSGSSKGAQTIRLIDSGKGETEILHSSIHQTENVLRDQTLYPIYHRKAIKEVHRNINKILFSK
jgi:hypothetical protein